MATCGVLWDDQISERKRRFNGKSSGGRRWAPFTLPMQPFHSPRQRKHGRDSGLLCARKRAAALLTGKRAPLKASRPVAAVTPRHTCPCLTLPAGKGPRGRSAGSPLAQDIDLHKIWPPPPSNFTPVHRLTKTLIVIYRELAPCCWNIII